MIAFSIMMWFVAIIMCMVAISLLRGNISLIHGKVFDNTEDKVGYGKKLGKLCLFMSLGVCIAGITAILINRDMAIICAVMILLVVVVISAIWFRLIQKHYMS